MMTSTCTTAEDAKGKAESERAYEKISLSEKSELIRRLRHSKQDCCSSCSISFHSLLDWHFGFCCSCLWATSHWVWVDGWMNDYGLKSTVCCRFCLLRTCRLNHSLSFKETTINWFLRPSTFDILLIGPHSFPFPFLFLEARFCFCSVHCSGGSEILWNFEKINK